MLLSCITLYDIVTGTDIHYYIHKEYILESNTCPSRMHTCLKIACKEPKIRELLYPIVHSSFQSNHIFTMPNTQVASTTQIPLNAEELFILRSHLDQWKETPRNERRQFLKTVTAEVRVVAPRMEDSLRKKRKTVSSITLHSCMIINTPC
jgi:hypothetical protein